MQLPIEDKVWPLAADEVEAAIAAEIFGLVEWRLGAPVFAKMEDNGTWTIRPRNRLGPTTFNVPARFVVPVPLLPF